MDLGAEHSATEFDAPDDKLLDARLSDDKLPDERGDRHPAGHRIDRDQAMAHADWL